ncbi:hypothetical protein ACHHYP_11897 [Achlya hypogyna]|uniref:Secreted protein n=1 Tax=Achlya hypogyna TaxID=1202772 RepID=A0A1V9YI61_ACHHY|nr:hypothetical protein ACHHYP_11897 [Achlya hypogyna]
MRRGLHVLILLATLWAQAAVCINATAQNATPTATPVTVTSPPTTSPVPPTETPSPAPTTTPPPPTTTAPPTTTVTPEPTTATPEPTTTAVPLTTSPPTTSPPVPTTANVTTPPTPEILVLTPAATLAPQPERIPTIAKEVASSTPPEAPATPASSSVSWKFYAAIAAGNVAVVAFVVFVLFRRRAAKHRKTMNSFDSVSPHPVRRPFDSNSVEVDLIESSVVSYEMLTPCENIVTSGYSSVDPSSSMRMSKLSFMSEGDEALDDLDDVAVLSHENVPAPKGRWSAFNIRPEFPGNISTTLRATYPTWQERLSKGSNSMVQSNDGSEEPPTPAHDPEFPKMLSAQSNWSQWQDGHSFSGDVEEWNDESRDSYMTDDAPRISLESAGVDWHLGSADDWHDSMLR